MSQALRQQLGLRPELRGMPRQTALMLQLGQQQLCQSLAAMAEQNPLLEIPEHALPRAPAPSQSLVGHVCEQLARLPMPARERADALACAQCLDERGYLPQPDALAGMLGLGKARARRAAGAIRSLEPVGVGAHDLADCLLLQLANLPQDATCRAASTLVREHFTSLSKRRHDLLPPSHLQGALALLASLQPRLGSAYAAGTEAIIPDLRAWRDAGVWRVASLQDAPLATLAPGAHRDNLPNPAWRRKLREARQVLAGLEFRRSALLRVAQALVDHQRGFLERGMSSLRPLRLREVAAETGLALSTVSTTIRNKHLSTPQGVIALKLLIQRGTGTSSQHSATALREAIRQVIATEDPMKPLSDQKILLALRDQGIAIGSRRTITKHRLAAGVDNACLRKRVPS